MKIQKKQVSATRYAKTKPGEITQVHTDTAAAMEAVIAKPEKIADIRARLEEEPVQLSEAAKKLLAHKWKKEADTAKIKRE